MLFLRIGRTILIVIESKTPSPKIVTAIGKIMQVVKGAKRMRGQSANSATETMTAISSGFLLKRGAFLDSIEFSLITSMSLSK